MADVVVDDLFAGPGGWEMGASTVGLHGIRGIEHDAAACATARAAGFDRLQADITTVTPPDSLDGLIASPPCPSFSAAGNGLGKLDLPHIIAHIEAAAAAGEWLPYAPPRIWDERSALTLEPLRWIMAAAPTWIAMEQVPGVLPIWHAYAALLRGRGYSVAVGKLSAEQYGVPQTRQRAILIASLTREVSLPAPTHQRYRKGQADDGSGLPRPVSMAEALGWGLPHRPSWTVSGGGTDTGGAEPFANAGNRRELAQYLRSNSADHDRPRHPETGKLVTYDPETGVDYYYRTPTTEPAPTITTQTMSGGGWDSGPAKRGEHIGHRVTVQEAGILQTFPADHPWQGKKGQQYQQVGNAIPPLLAAAVLRQVVG